MLLEEAVAASDTLTYGEDKGGALKKAVDEARVLLVSGEARERMAAYHALLDAMEQYRLDNASVAHPVDLTARIQMLVLTLEIRPGGRLRYRMRTILSSVRE